MSLLNPFCVINFNRSDAMLKISALKKSKILHFLYAISHSRNGMTRYILLLAGILLLNLSASGQELNCSVDIEYSKTQSTDPKVFKTLQTSIAEFMSTRKWTNDVYEPHEKINCSIIINIEEEISENEFAGQFLIQSDRPVFNSTYNTVVFSFKDDNFRIIYNEFDNLEFSDNNFTSNLTSLLAFYAYVIIGFDYDSYSPKGGTPMYLKAQDVVTSIPGGQRARFGGWDPFGSSRNRAIMIGHLTNPRYYDFRSALYEWHFEGLDNMYSNPEKSRETITESLDLIESVYVENPNTMLLKIFFLAKSEEIVNIFSAASTSEKNDIIERVSNLDPVNTTKYEGLRK